MTATIDLTPEEIEELKALTNQGDVTAAVRFAMAEYLQYARRQRLKAISGHVEMQENWPQLEGLELKAIHEDHGPGPH
jgi:hypothetical protein